jgi:mono/diheme cytochrome c family protein
MQRIILGMAVMFGLAACGGGQNAMRSSAILALTGDAAAGQMSYASRCVMCHGPDGKSGTARHDVPGHAKNKPTETVNELLVGNAAGMPSYANLTDQQLADLLAYLKTL